MHIVEERNLAAIDHQRVVAETVLLRIGYIGRFRFLCGLHLGWQIFVNRRLLNLQAALMASVETPDPRVGFLQQSLHGLLSAILGFARTVAAEDVQFVVTCD